MAYPSPRCFGVALWLAGTLGLATVADASQVRLKSGEVYPDATVLRLDATSVELRLPHGRTTLPLSLVDRIDGVPVTPVPTPLPTVAHTQTARPFIRETPRPTVPRSLFPVAATPVPVPSSSPKPVSALSSSYRRVGWLTLAVVVVLYLWSLTLPRLLADRRSGETSSPWWYAAFLGLPGLGYCFYLVWQMLIRRARARQPAPIPLEFLDADHHPIPIDPTSTVFSGIQSARDILENALLRRASDVHIEPAAQEHRVRLRVDGMMLPDRTLPANDGVRLVSALKTLAQADIAERRKAQDGRFGARQGSRTVDFRLATVPSVHGEKVVLRILDRKIGVRGLENLGMLPEMQDRFAKIVHSRSGMILATGPTGSGKTSTLYAALAQLDASRLNLVTIEDPVEYELAGATQIPVDAKAGVTFKSGLQSILRQDPDVIFVGEIRDLESAQIALRAALTGHLVFSSLHTRDAVGAVMRLEEMGIESHLVASALFVVLSQRLVRVLCDTCREPYEARGDELLSLGIEFDPGATLYRPVGCRKCEGTGYLGRTGIFEMLVLDEEVRQSVNNGTSEDDLLKLARRKGFASYREDGAMKILLGTTTVDEVLRSI